jgi:hypothetical protein
MVLVMNSQSAMVSVLSSEKNLSVLRKMPYMVMPQWLIKASTSSGKTSATLSTTSVNKELIKL